jgi:hypothetical protein
LAPGYLESPEWTTAMLSEEGEHDRLLVQGKLHIG